MKVGQSTFQEVTRPLRPTNEELCMLMEVGQAFQEEGLQSRKEGTERRKRSLDFQVEYHIRSKVRTCQPSPGFA